jgi:hypothetical protein
MNAWALFNNYNTYQMLLCQRYSIYNIKNSINHVKFYAENFRRSGHGGGGGAGLNPHQPRQYATGRMTYS